METKNKNYLVPIAIVSAEIIIAGAMLLNNSGGGGLRDNQNTKQNNRVAKVSAGVENMKPVSADDYILAYQFYFSLIAILIMFVVLYFVTKEISTYVF